MSSKDAFGRCTITSSSCLSHDSFPIHTTTNSLYRIYKYISHKFWVSLSLHTVTRTTYLLLKRIKGRSFDNCCLLTGGRIVRMGTSGALLRQGPICDRLPALSTCFFLYCVRPSLTNLFISSLLCQRKRQANSTHHKTTQKFQLS